MRTINTILALQTSSIANLLVYYIRKLPFMGKVISAQFYAKNNMKKMMAIIARILITLTKIASSFTYVGLVLYWPITLLGEQITPAQQWNYFVHLFFMISFIAAGISSAIILEPKRSKYITVKLLRMSPTRYIKATLVYKYVSYFIFLTPAVLLFGTMLGGQIVELFALVASATLWRVGCEYLHLKYFEKTGNILVKQTGLVWLCLGVCYAAAFTPLIFRMTPFTDVLLLRYYLVIVFIALGIFAVNQLKRYRDYRTVVDAATKRDDPLLNMEQLVADANKANVQSKEDDYVIEEIGENQFKTKQGYAYLNALFFARHRRIVRRPLTMRLYIVAIVGLVGIIAALYFQPFADFYIHNMTIIFSALALAMLYLSVGERTCKAMFFNCDLSMLKYSFYRSAAFQHFTIRLFTLSKQNILIAIALSFVLTIIYVVAGGQLLDGELLLLWICLFCFAIFFSVHHLFLYYILQPYTTELNLKNPLFLIVTFVVSAACTTSVFVQAPAPLFTVVIFLLTVIYTLAALLLVRQYGPRSFRVK